MARWLEAQGLTVWLDVSMAKRSEAAMKEGVKNSKCVIAIITGSFYAEQTSSRASFDEHAEENAYFNRKFCIQELRWAKSFDVHIQPVMSMDDKKRVGEFLEQAPKDLKFIGGTDWIDLNRSKFFFFSYSLSYCQKRCSNFCFLLITYCLLFIYFCLVLFLFCR